MYWSLLHVYYHHLIVTLSLCIFIFDSSSSQQCNDGVTSYVKISQVIPIIQFTTPTGVLYEEPSHAITLECLAACREQSSCQALILDYEHSKCASYAQAGASDNQLTSFAAGSYFEKICLHGIFDQVDLRHYCPFDRVWTIERSPSSLLVAFIMSQVALNSIDECATICLKDTNCRSASYQHSSQKCLLSKESKRTQPQAFRIGVNDWTYIENQCTMPASICSFDRKFNATSASNRRTLRSIDLIVYAQTWTQCEIECKNEKSFICRAYSHSGNRCLLSSDDSITVNGDVDTFQRQQAVNNDIVTVGQLICISDECSGGSFVYESIPGFYLSSAKESAASNANANVDIGSSLTTLALKECDSNGLNCPSITVDHSRGRIFNLDRNSQGRSLELTPLPGKILYEKMCLNPPVNCVSYNSSSVVSKIIFKRLPGIALANSFYFKILPNVQSRRDCEQHCLSHSSNYASSLIVCRSALYNEVTAQCKLSNSSFTPTSTNYINEHLDGVDEKLSLRISYLENLCETIGQVQRTGENERKCPFKVIKSRAKFTYPDTFFRSKDPADCESLCRNDMKCMTFAFSLTKTTCFLAARATEHDFADDQDFDVYRLTCDNVDGDSSSTSGESNEINTSPVESTSADGASGRNVTDESIDPGAQSRDTSVSTKGDDGGTSAATAAPVSNSISPVSKDDRLGDLDSSATSTLPTVAENTSSTSSSSSSSDDSTGATTETSTPSTQTSVTNSPTTASQVTSESEKATTSSETASTAGDTKTSTSVTSEQSESETPSTLPVTQATTTTTKTTPTTVVTTASTATVTPTMASSKTSTVGVDTSTETTKTQNVVSEQTLSPSKESTMSVTVATVQSTESSTLIVSPKATEASTVTSIEKETPTSTSQNSVTVELTTKSSTVTSTSTEISATSMSTSSSLPVTSNSTVSPSSQGSSSTSESSVDSYCQVSEESTYERIPGFEPISPDYYFTPLCKSTSKEPGILKDCSHLCSRRSHCRGFVIDYKNHLCYGLMSDTPLRTLSLCIAEDKDFYERICIPKVLSCNRLWTFERIVDQAVSPSVLPRYTIPFITREACKCLCMQEKRFVCRSVTFEKRLSVCRIYDVSRESISSLIGFMSTSPEESFTSVQSSPSSSSSYQQQLLTFTTGLEYYENMCAAGASSPCAYMPPNHNVLPYSPIQSLPVSSLHDCRHTCDVSNQFNCRAFAFIDLVSKGSSSNQCFLFADNSYTLKRGSLRLCRDALLFQKHCPVIANYHFRYHDKGSLYDLLQERQRQIERTTYTFPTRAHHSMAPSQQAIPF